jgi:hypothetical protein
LFVVSFIGGKKMKGRLVSEGKRRFSAWRAQKKKNNPDNFLMYAQEYYIEAITSLLLHDIVTIRSLAATLQLPPFIVVSYLWQDSEVANSEVAKFVTDYRHPRRLVH